MHPLFVNLDPYPYPYPYLYPYPEPYPKYFYKYFLVSFKRLSVCGFPGIKNHYIIPKHIYSAVPFSNTFFKFLMLPSPIILRNSGSFVFNKRLIKLKVVSIESFFFLGPYKYFL